MDPLTIAGLASTGVGLLGKLFGKSDEDIRRERHERRLKEIREARVRTLGEGSRRIGEQTAAGAAAARQAGAARAIASGRGNEVESFVVPVEQRALTAGSESLKDFTLGTNRYFDGAEMNAEGEFADRPIAPDWTDYAGELGSGQATYGLQKEALDADYEDIPQISGSENMPALRTTPQTPIMGGLSPTTSLRQSLGTVRPRELPMDELSSRMFAGATQPRVGSYMTPEAFEMPVLGEVRPRPRRRQLFGRL